MYVPLELNKTTIKLSVIHKLAKIFMPSSLEYAHEIHGGDDDDDDDDDDEFDGDILGQKCNYNCS
jgi:hypothetical protein